MVNLWYILCVLARRKVLSYLFLRRVTSYRVNCKCGYTMFGVTRWQQGGFTL